MSHFDGLRTLRVELDAPLAQVILNRPEKLNALNVTMIGELETVFDHLRTSLGIRVVVLTGAGEKAFVAGADIQELGELDAAKGREFSRRGNDVFRRLERFPLPVIAAVNGYALGGGLELAMACTLRLASENARLGQPEVKLGIMPGYGGTQRLARLIGTGRALEMILSGEPITAAEAQAWGLVNRVLPAAELMPAAVTLARKIAANAPLAIEYCMQAVRDGMDTTLEHGLQLEAALFGLSCASDDMKEGTRAFLEKRAPQFRGQ